VPFDADGTIDLSGRGTSIDIQATVAGPPPPVAPQP
jgi:hypothetical protein